MQISLCWVSQKVCMRLCSYTNQVILSKKRPISMGWIQKAIAAWKYDRNMPEIRGFHEKFDSFSIT
jgi:hypothetical protein